MCSSQFDETALSSSQCRTCNLSSRHHEKVKAQLPAAVQQGSLHSSSLLSRRNEEET